MEPLKSIEAQITVLEELETLFSQVSPSELRRSIEDLFFKAMSHSDTIGIPPNSHITEHIHHLITFLAESEKAIYKK
ncbi:MAG: hypothetical protein RIF46_02370 [Cyclobacteriaceae bacterium]